MSDNADEPSLGRLARKWLKQKIGPLAGDPMQNRQREVEADATEAELKRRVSDQAERKIAAAILPPSWNQMLEDARPENRAARYAAEHRAELEAGDKAHLSLTLSGDVSGVIDATVPFHADFNAEARVWRVELEALDPIPVGGTVFRRFVFTVPLEARDGVCEMAQWTRENEDRYDPFDFECQLDSEIEPQQWTADFGASPAQVMGSTVIVHMPTQDAGSRSVVVDASVECPEGTFSR